MASAAHRCAAEHRLRVTDLEQYSTTQNTVLLKENPLLNFVQEKCIITKRCVVKVNEIKDLTIHLTAPLENLKVV
jgi:hypothetical protein